MEWRNIPKFPDYEVSENGDVRSKVSGHVLRPFINPWGRSQYRLRRDGRYVTVYGDNLTADAFLADVLEESRTNRVIHLDGDHSNNNWLNLAFYRGRGRRRSR